jgi:hypothetical protein
VWLEICHAREGGAKRKFGQFLFRGKINDFFNDFGCSFGVIDSGLG